MGLTVVGTVRARDQFLVLSLVREPSLQIIFNSGSVVETARDNVDQTIRDAERLIELARVGDHGVKLGWGSLGFADDKLFNFLELVNSEDTPSVPTVRTGLLSETCRVTGIALSFFQSTGMLAIERRMCSLEGQVLGIEVFVHVIGRDRLLTGSNQVHVLSTSRNLVKSLIKVFKLSGRTHNLLLDHKRGLNFSESLLP